MSEKVKGEIGYFGLSDWWFSTFTQEERRFINSTYTIWGSEKTEPLTKGELLDTSQTPADVLAGMIGTLADKPEYLHLVDSIISKAESATQGQREVLGLHFAYQTAIKVAYRLRDKNPRAIETAIRMCEKQIKLAPNAAKQFKRENPTEGLPAHVGYTQLVIILEKQKDYLTAIRLAKQAKEQGWNDDWDKRIARCEERLSKQKGSR